MSDLGNLINSKFCIKLFVLYLFFAILLIPLIGQNVLLSDDLARVASALDHKNDTGFWGYIYDFLNTDTMSSRPVSGVVTALVTYAAGFYEKLYYLGYLFFLVSLYFFQKTVFSITKCSFFAFIATVIYALIPIGNPLVFSPLMLNSSLATIFYCLSLLWLTKNKNSKIDFLLSIAYFILSVLSYEIFLPMVFTNILFLKKRQKVGYIVVIVAVIAFYRQIAEPFLFNNFFHRDNSQVVFDFKRDILVIGKILKSLTYDSIIGIFRSVVAIRYYSFIDYLSLIIFNLIIFYFIKNSKEKSIILPKNTELFLVSSLLLSVSIFFVSNYVPSVKGYSGRTMGALRWFLSFSIVWILLKYSSKKMLFIFVMIFSISIVSIKNAWQYSYEVNNQIFSKINQCYINQKIDLKKSNQLYVVFTAQDFLHYKNNFIQEQRKDRYFFFKNQHFVLEEPMFFAPWEYTYYSNLFGWDKQLEVRYFYYSEEKKTLPYYLYHVRQNQLMLINH